MIFYYMLENKGKLKLKTIKSYSILWWSIQLYSILYCIIENDATAEEAMLFHVVGSFLCRHSKVGGESMQIIFWWYGISLSSISCLKNKTVFRTVHTAYCCPWWLSAAPWPARPQTVRKLGKVMWKIKKKKLTNQWTAVEVLKLLYSSKGVYFVCHSYWPDFCIWWYCNNYF